MKSLQYLLVCAPSGVFRPKARRNGETLLQQIEEERNESIMENNNVIEAVKGLHEVIRRQQGIMSPDSNGKGHGKLLRTISENEGISGVELALKMDIAPPVVSEKTFRFGTGRSDLPGTGPEGSAQNSYLSDSGRSDGSDQTKIRTGMFSETGKGVSERR